MAPGAAITLLPFSILVLLATGFDGDLVWRGLEEEWDLGLDLGFCG